MEQRERTACPSNRADDGDRQPFRLAVDGLSAGETHHRLRRWKGLDGFRCPSTPPRCGGDIMADWSLCASKQAPQSIGPLERENMEWDVTQVRVVNDCTLHVSFRDGIAGLVHFDATFFSGVFEPLRNSVQFRTAQVVDGYVTWPSSNVDL